MQQKESTDLPLLKKQLAETEKGINNMLNAIQAGIFTPSTKQRLDELEETKSQLEVSILQEEMHKPLLTREQIAFFIYRFRKFDVTKREQRQRLIDSFVNAVYLYEDKIILTFNYKDGSKTITLAEVEGSDLSVLGARKTQVERLESFCVIKATFFRGYDKRVRDQSLNKRANMLCTENFNTPLSDRERKSALETWIELIQPGETMKSVGCEWTDDGKISAEREGERLV